MAQTTSWSGRRRTLPAKTRRAILHRDPTCQIGGPGCTGTALEVDHIIGVADALAAGWAPDDIDDPSNLQGACPTCHGAKTRAEQSRGRARKARRRPPEPHPGLIDNH